jgi:ATP-dependent exoDNAse (exonuclease V) alpha subunit
MIALRRRDVAELNALARALMDSHGRLGRKRLTIAGTEFAAGDRVVCLRNDDSLGVKNGTRATVEAVDRRRRTLGVVTDRGERVELGRSYLEAGQVRHAYALTGHAGQGVTVERVFVLGIGGQRLQEWGYVALSRARHETRLYVTGVPRERESHFHDLDDRDPVTRLGQALEESAIERLAVDQRPLPVGPLHDTRAEIEQFNPTAELRARLRLLEQQRLAITKARQQAKRTLQDAENRLDRLGPFRGGRRRRLLGDVARSRTAVRMADERLTELAEQARQLRTVPPGPRAPQRPAADLPSATRLAPELNDGAMEL